MTEAIYQGLFAETDGAASIHLARWPVVDERWVDDTAVSLGEILIEIATAVRRYKSEHNLSLGVELPTLHLAARDEKLATALNESTTDLISVSRASKIIISAQLNPTLVTITTNGAVKMGLSSAAEKS